MFRDVFDIYETLFEVYIEDKLVNRQTMQAPKEMIMINFIQTVEQIKNDQRPIRIKLIRPEIIYDSFEDKEKVFNNEVEFCNNAMLSWQENKEK